ncbi:hypothetical protein BDZ97DRAFT_1807010 [Flammula alnicola]|nr:hypothetical protein BDZ97DRAFT_1807010 [Flammula alnicola]
MSTSWLLSLLLGLWRLLSRIMKPGLIRRALASILGRLAFWGSTFHSRTSSSGRGINEPLSSTKEGQPTGSKEESKIKEDSKE